MVVKIPLVALLIFALQAPVSRDEVVAIVNLRNVKRSEAPNGNALADRVLHDLLNDYRERHHIKPAKREIRQVQQRGGAPQIDAATAEEFLTAFKVDQALWAQYGGRVVIRRFGPTPVDAYRRLLEDAQKPGAFTIVDKSFEADFWRSVAVGVGADLMDEARARKMMTAPWWLDSADTRAD